MTNITCPVEKEPVTIPAEWDQDITFHGVLVHDREWCHAAWLAFHILKAHGREALISFKEAMYS